MDLCHRDGSLKREVAENPAKYIHEVCCSHYLYATINLWREQHLRVISICSVQTATRVASAIRLPKVNLKGRLSCQFTHVHHNDAVMMNLWWPPV